MLIGFFIRQEQRAAEPIIPLKLFRSVVFSVASSLGFVIGLAMFGAIIFIPLFLQLVYGVSPTSSGLRMLPLMAGLLTASILSGRAITRIGRYKPFPIAGTAVTTVGLFLLSRLEVDTPPWVASVYMLVLGVGLGLVMQVIVLVVQNDVEPRDIGVATSTATFFRSMGGSLGVALFGAIFASRLASRAQRAAARTWPGASPAASTSARSRCTRSARRSATTSCSRSSTRCSPCSWSARCSRSSPFVLACFLKEVPLRGSNRTSSDLTVEEAAAGATGAEAIIDSSRATAALALPHRPLHVLAVLDDVRAVGGDLVAAGAAVDRVLASVARGDACRRRPGRRPCPCRRRA